MSFLQDASFVQVEKASLQPFLYIFRVCIGGRNSEEKGALAAWKATILLLCIRQSVAKRLRKVILPCTVLATHAWHWHSRPSAGLPSGDSDILERVQARDCKT